MSASENKRDIKWLQNRVKILKKKPQPEQRTPAWYIQRQTRITASEAASCLFKSESVCKPYVNEFQLKNFKYKPSESINPYESKEDYIIKKCSAYFGEAVFKDTVFTLWGKKYEEVANRLYSKLYNTKVDEFGLISHSRVKWLAASPDGITPDGVMLEIKCPKSRKIDITAPPLYYWCQVQIQLEVCDLEECHFFECEIIEIEKEEEFLQLQLEKDKPQDLGIALQIPRNENETGDPKYIYPPIELLTISDYINWKNEMMNQNDKLIPTYFYITKYNNIVIKRSREWFSAVKDDIKKTWQIIMNLQANQQDFLKYKESIDNIKNKDFNHKFDTTICLIDDNTSVFEFESDFEQECQINTTE
jgi:putative phage-type endonuclease